MTRNKYGAPLSPEISSPERPLRFDDVVADIKAMEGVSLQERKNLLINYEIDSQGMGKYQWCIWGLCGFGYLLDLMWAQAFGLVLSPLQQEFGFGGDQSGQISIAFSAGLTAGAATFGILVDVIGRKWAFNLSTLISSAFGLGLGAASNYTTFLVLTAFVGFGIGGNIPIDTTITLEFIPESRRRLLPLLSIFQPVGVVVTTAIAYGFIPTNSCTPDWTQGDQALASCNNARLGTEPPQCCGKSNNMGWRYTLYTVGGITLSCFILRFFVFNFRESPKFLIFRGKDEKAVRVLQQVAKFNGASSMITLDTFESLAIHDSSASSQSSLLSDGGGRQVKLWSERYRAEVQRFRLLFSSFSMTRLTLFVWAIYFCDYWGFTLAATYLPTILSLKNASIQVSVQESYREYVYIYLPGILGVLLGVLCYDLPHLGRKWTMVVSSGLMGASIFIFATVNSTASNIGINAMEYFFQSMFNAVLYGWTPEAFPPPIRGTASGLASFWGRLGSILAPIAGQSLLPISPEVTDYVHLLYLAGGVTLACVVLTGLLPSHLVGKTTLKR